MIDEKHENLKNYIFYHSHKDIEFENDSENLKKYKIGKKYSIIGDYLIEERKFHLKTLIENQIGIGEEMFKDELDNYKLIPCIYFPMKKLD